MLFFVLFCNRYPAITSSWTTTFTVQPPSVDIVYLEHVVVNMSLAIHNYGVGYNVDDFETEANYALDADELYRWLEDPHPRRGNIKIELTSPHGTVSTLLPYRKYDFVNEEGYSDWPFMSVQHWGENPIGTWTLKVTFKSSLGAWVTASGVSMTLHGPTAIPQSVSAIPAACDSACARKCSGSRSSDCDGCKDYRVASTLECVSVCPNTTYAHNKYCLSKSLSYLVLIAVMMHVLIIHLQLVLVNQTTTSSIQVYFTVHHNLLLVYWSLELHMGLVISCHDIITGGGGSMFFSGCGIELTTLVYFWGKVTQITCPPTIIIQ